MTDDIRKTFLAEATQFQSWDFESDKLDINTDLMGRFYCHVVGKDDQPTEAVALNENQARGLYEWLGRRLGEIDEKR